jgi:APA family basic amino acid/polyamine antiporter
MERLPDPAGAADHRRDSLTAAASSADGARPNARRPLGSLSLLALGLNGIVGVGIFFAPREVAAAAPGLAGLSVYAVVALLLLPVGLVFARLGRALTVDGGPYVYARSAFGPNVAFAVGFTTFVSAVFSTAAVVVGLVEHAALALGVHSAMERLFAELALVFALMFALSRGLRLSALVWTAVTVLKMAPLVALPLAALGAAPASAPTSSRLGGVTLAAALPVLFALQGFEVVPLPAGEVTNAKRSVPMATLGSLLLAAALYLCLHAACLRALPDLAAHEAPLADAAKVFGGAAFSQVIVLATSLSALGIVIGMLAMTPRYLAPLGHADALGFRLDEQDSRAIPLRAFRVTLVLVSLVLVANAFWGSLAELLALSSVSVTMQYAVTAAALWVLASRGTAGLAPSDRWPAPLAIASCAVLLAGATRVEIPIFVALLGLGFAARATGRALAAKTIIDGS